MKKTFIYLSAAAALVACRQEDVKVEDPNYIASSTNSIEISGVEINDSLTVIDVNAKYRPKNWIRIASTTTLQADGKEYRLVGADGIEPDSLFWMPESGKASFKLMFEPLPKGTKEFDFIEANESGAFNFWGINLDNSLDYASIPAEVPASMRAAGDMDLSTLKPAIGKVKLNVQLLNYRPAFGSEMSFYVNQPLLNQEEISAKIDDSGFTSIEVPVYGLGAYIIPVINSNSLALFTISPADSVVNAYLDMRYLGAVNKYIFNDNKKLLVSGNQFVYTDGVTAPYNALPSRLKSSPYKLIDANKPYYRMTAEEYTNDLYNRYQAVVDSIKAMDAPEFAKQIMQQGLNYELADAILFPTSNQIRSFFNATGSWDRSVLQDSVKFSTLPEEQIKKISEYIKFDNHAFPFYMNTYITVDGIRKAGLETEGMLKVESIMQPYISQAQAGTITDEAINEAASMVPEYAEFITATLTDLRNRAIEVAAAATVKPETAPDVPLDQLFAAIVAPYKGKVVMVDFWNTWCGPCRAALKANEPLKETELNDDDLVFVYIANETSPMPKYLSMIPDIKGVHYRLNDEQWRQLADKDFDLDGIPSYVLVDRNGKATLRNDLRDHDLYVKTVKEALSKK